METPSEFHNEPMGGMKSTHGSQGELADRGGTPGFPTGAVETVSGSATTKPDRNAAGYENEV